MFIDGHSPEFNNGNAHSGVICNLFKLITSRIGGLREGNVLNRVRLFIGAALISQDAMG